MSRYYEMHILVKGFTSEDVITAAVEDEWNISDSWAEDGGTLFTGTGNLVAGEGEDEFSRRMRNAIWRANEAFCEIEVRCVYLDDPPTTFHIFNEEDYRKWKKAQSPAPRTTS